MKYVVVVTNVRCRHMVGWYWHSLSIGGKPYRQISKWPHVQRNVKGLCPEPWAACVCSCADIFEVILARTGSEINRTKECTFLFCSFLPCTYHSTENQTGKTFLSSHRAKQFSYGVRTYEKIHEQVWKENFHFKFWERRYSCCLCITKWAIFMYAKNS